MCSSLSTYIAGFPVIYIKQSYPQRQPSVGDEMK